MVMSPETLTPSPPRPTCTSPWMSVDIDGPSIPRMLPDIPWCASPETSTLPSDHVTAPSTDAVSRVPRTPNSDCDTPSDAPAETPPPPTSTCSLTPTEPTPQRPALADASSLKEPAPVVTCPDASA